MRNVKSIGLTFFLAVHLIGCATPQKPSEPIQLPENIKGLFKNCDSGDGALHLQALKGDAFAGSGDLDWLAHDRSWKAEIINHVGGSLLKFEYKRGATNIDISGSYASNLPPITLDGAEFIMIDQHFIGVKASEVPCMVSMRLPAKWLNDLYKFERSGNSVSLDFFEKARSIRAEIEFTDDGKPYQICSRMRWSVFMGIFHSDVFVCNRADEKHSGSASGLNEYELKWVDIDS